MCVNHKTSVFLIQILVPSLRMTTKKPFPKADVYESPKKLAGAL